MERADKPVALRHLHSASLENLHEPSVRTSLHGFAKTMWWLGTGKNCMDAPAARFRQALGAAEHVAAARVIQPGLMQLNVQAFEAMVANLHYQRGDLWSQQEGGE